MHVDYALVYLIVTIIGFVGTAVYFVAKVEASTDANKEALEASTKANKEALDASSKSNKEALTESVGHLKELIQLNDKNSKDNMNQEIGHLKEFFESKITDVKEDIGRLEKKQEESNQIKERLVVQEQSGKSLHKRVDRLDSIANLDSNVA